MNKTVYYTEPTTNGLLQVKRVTETYEEIPIPPELDEEENEIITEPEYDEEGNVIEPAIRYQLVSKQNHRYVLHPGADLTDQPQEVVKAANMAWTPEIIAAYEQSIKPEPLTPKQQFEQLKSIVDKYIDRTAQAKGYDSRITCVMRTGYQNPWQEEAVAFGKWMDFCYSKAIEIIDKVKSGKKQMPTKESFLAEMPEMVWPSGEPLPGLEDIK